MHRTKHYALILLLAFSLLSVLGCRKKGPEDLLEEAIEALKRGDFWGASYKFENIIKADPDGPISQDARFFWGNCLFESGDSEEARAKWGEILQRVPLTEAVAQKAFTNRLVSWEKEGKISEAVAEIRKTSQTLVSVPDFGKLMLQQLARLHARNNEPDKAEAVLLDLKASAKVGPESYAAGKALGDFYVQRQQYEKARNLFQQMREVAANEDEILLTMRDLAGVLALNKESDEAVNLYQAYLDQHPDTQHKAILLWGIAALRKLAADEAQDEQVKSTLKGASDKAYAESIEAARKALSAEILDEKKIPHLLQIAQIYASMGEARKGAEELQAHLEKMPEGDRAWMQLGRRIVDTYLAIEDFEQAKVWLKKIAEALPGTNESQQALQTIANIDGYVKKREAEKAAASTQGAEVKEPAAVSPEGAAVEKPAAVSPEGAVVEKPAAAPTKEP